MDKMVLDKMEMKRAEFSHGICSQVSKDGDNCVCRLGRCSRPSNDLPTKTTTPTKYPSYAKDDLELLSGVRHCRALLPLLPRSTTPSPSKPCVKCKILARDSHRKQLKTLETKFENTTNSSYSSRTLCDRQNSSSQTLWYTRDSICLQCHSCRTKCWTKSKMIRLTGKILVLCVIILCVAYVIGFPSRSTDISNTEVKIGGPDNIVMEDKFKSISIHEYSRKIVNSKSHYDVLRMFLKDAGLPEDKIDTLFDVDTNTRASKREYDYYSDDNGYYDEEEDVIDTMEKAQHHFDEIYGGPLGQCRDPRAEVVRVQEHGDLHKEYFPKFTVLHRCRSVSGCCWDESQECQEKRVQVVKRPFIVLERLGNTVNLGTNGPSRDNVEWLFFVNHTECECRRVDTLPECRKSCPHPFIMTRPEEECICDCMRDAPHCQQIKYGLKPLGEEGYDCIKSGDCQKPTCAEGVFDMRKGTGYCGGTTHGGIEIHHILKGNNYKHRNRHAHRHAHKHKNKR